MWFPISLEVLGFSLSTHGPCCLHDAWFPATWPRAPLLCPCLSVCCCNRTKAQKGQVTCQGFKTRQCDISCGQVLTTTLGFNVRMALKGDFWETRKPSSVPRPKGRGGIGVKRNKDGWSPFTSLMMFLELPTRSEVGMSPKRNRWTELWRQPCDGRGRAFFGLACL